MLQRSQHFVTLWTAVALAVVTWAEPDAYARCRSTCTDTLRACRTQCAPLRGGDRRECRRGCADASTCAAPGAPLPVLAYSVNECDEDAQGFVTLSQKLVVRRGNCDPVTAMSTSGRFRDPLAALVPGHPACRNYGEIRIGFLSSIVGRFQRVGVLAHGAGVVFEVASYPILGFGLPSSPDDGLYFVRTDGTGLRRLGPALGFGPFVVVHLDGGFGGLNFTFDRTDQQLFASSPDGGRIAFTAPVPDANGTAARQIVVLDVKSGRSTQVTHLPPAPSGAKDTCCPLFADDRTIIFFDSATGSLASVPANGTGDPAAIPGLQSVPGATVTPQFGIVSTGAGNAYSLAIDGKLERRYAPSDQLHEVFLLRGTQALQLTDLHYPDTGQEATLGVDKVIFVASADADATPGTNPAGMCQLFSVPVLGGPIRQITRFPDDAPLLRQGCSAPTSFDASCRVNGLFQDLATRTILFTSSCDPLGRTRHGEQAFTMRPDGTGLRQVTDFAGVESFADGRVHVEMGGPYATSAALR